LRAEYREKRDVRSHQERDSDRFFALRMPAKCGPLVVGIAEFVLARCAMMLMEVEAPEAPLVFPDTVQDVLVDDPLSRIRIQEP